MIYLDQAATSYPKPPAVPEAVVRCMRYAGGNAGRGAHTLALRAAEEIYRCREEVASFFGLDTPENVVFTLNTTYALNQAIGGVLDEGDHVLIGDMSHNAVYRPVYRLAGQGRITYDTFSSNRGAEEVLASLSRRVRPDTRAVIVPHLSNIENTEAPLGAIGAFCRRRGICLIVDAAQSAGVLPIDVPRMKIDILCAPGHKGLYGPQGCGLLLVGNEKYASLRPLVSGGSGVNSLDPVMPDVLPEHLEAGTLPTPVLAGLTEGIRFVRRIGLGTVAQHERRLHRIALSRLDGMPGVRVFSRVPGGTVLFTAEGHTPTELAERLCAAGIAVRAGLHCAPLAHAALGTGEGGGVRVSFGVMNTEEELHAFADALRCIL